MGTKPEATYYGIEFSYLDIALSVIFTVIIFLFTTFFAISTPATQGFFNFGEIGVYISALIGGPIVGAIAGGLGSALADIFLGYAHYAPGTLVIKGVEGFLAGYLFQRLRGAGREIRLLFGLVAAAIIAIVLSYHGAKGLSMVLEIRGQEYSLTLPLWVVLLIIGGLATALIITGSRGDIFSVMTLSCLIAGVEMVLGYYLYEAIVLGYGFIIAAMELPVNIGQAVIGTAIGVPTVRALMEMGLSVGSEESQR
ncbi:MAG: ECF transporter S component [Candidatus Njordarchaeales archaeon]